MNDSPRVLLIACVRNEGAFLVDWIAHHRAIGFTDILMYSNDCQDGSDLILDRLAAMGVLEHRRNPGPYQGGVQFTAMKLAAKEPVYKAADWVMPLDLDEYLNIHVGARRVADLIAAVPDVSAISVTWRMFGNAGVVEYSDAPVIQQFQRAAPEVMLWPWKAFLFKTLYRRADFARPGIHRPQRKTAQPLSGSWIDGEARVMPPAFTDTQRPFAYFGQPQYRLAQVNHYALQSVESFVLKADRGRAVHAGDQLGLDYWVERNWNQIEDRSITDDAIPRDQLKGEWGSDPALRTLTQTASAWRRDKFTELMRDGTNRELYGRLLMAGASEIVPKNQAMLIHSSEYKARGVNHSRK
ncbi:MAG: glycosyltransferase family 2 protein [Deltaproteobacteria bacterium]